MTNFQEYAAYIRTDSWAGRTYTACTVIGETPKRYRVRIDDNAFRWSVGDVILVPKYAIATQTERDAHAGR